MRWNTPALRHFVNGYRLQRDGAASLLTLDGLATALGLTESGLYRLEAGHTDGSIETLVAAYRFFWPLLNMPTPEGLRSLTLDDILIIDDQVPASPQPSPAPSPGAAPMPHLGGVWWNTAPLRKELVSRSHQGWTSAMMAQAMGVGSATLTRLETGRSGGSIETLVGAYRFFRERAADLRRTIHLGDVVIVQPTPDAG